MSILEMHKEMCEEMSNCESYDQSLELLSINGTEEGSDEKDLIDEETFNKELAAVKNKTENTTSYPEIATKAPSNLNPPRFAVKKETGLECMDWVAVVSEEGEEAIEIPTENDGTILLSSLKAQFSGASGLKFRNPSTNTLRGIRLLDDVLYAPYPGHGWGNHTYICAKSPDQAVNIKVAKKCETAVKRKFDTDPDELLPKNQRVDETDGNDIESDTEDLGTCDLIILNIPFSANEEEVRCYFEKYGDIAMFDLKKHEDGSSRGFAFVRFKKIEVQKKVTMTRHWINSRWCVVQIPDSQEISNAMADANNKIFVARLNGSIKAEHLRSHFECFGKVTDVFIPKPFRNYAFVTFTEQRSAEALFGRQHTIRGHTVHIKSAEPKGPTDKSARGNTARYRDSMNRSTRNFDDKMDWRDSLANDYQQFIECNNSRSNQVPNESYDGRTRYLNPWMNGYYDNERYFPERYQRRSGHY